MTLRTASRTMNRIPTTHFITGPAFPSRTTQMSVNIQEGSAFHIQFRLGTVGTHAPGVLLLDWMIEHGGIHALESIFSGRYPEDEVWMTVKRIRSARFPSLIVSWTYDDGVPATVQREPVRIMTSSTAMPPTQIFIPSTTDGTDWTNPPSVTGGTFNVYPASVTVPVFGTPLNPAPSQSKCADCDRSLFVHEVVNYPFRPGETVCGRCAGGTWVVTKAKFPGKCLKCKKEVSLGAVIRWAQGVGIKHADCSTQKELPKQKPGDRGWVEL